MALTERGMKMPLGYKARQVHRFICGFYAEHFREPTYEEIRTALGIGSKGEVSRIVASLEARGLHRRIGGGCARRIRIGGQYANR